VQIKKSFKPTSKGLRKNFGLKFLPKSSENILSNKSKYLHQMITVFPYDHFLYQMMIFTDWSVWFIDNFLKMPQLNRKYPSGAETKQGKSKKA